LKDKAGSWDANQGNETIVSWRRDICENLHKKILPFVARIKVVTLWHIKYFIEVLNLLCVALQIRGVS